MMQYAKSQYYLSFIGANEQHKGTAPPLVLSFSTSKSGVAKGEDTQEEE